MTNIPVPIIMNEIPQINKKMNMTLSFLVSACVHMCLVVYIGRQVVPSVHLPKELPIIIDMIALRPTNPPPAVEPKVVEPKVVEPKVVEPKVVEPKVVEPKVVEPKVVEPKVVEPKAVEPKVVEPKVVEPKALPKPKEIKPKTPSLEERFKQAEVKTEQRKTQTQTDRQPPPRPRVQAGNIKEKLQSAVRTSRTQTASTSTSSSYSGFTIEEERKDYADRHVRPVLEQLWQQPSSASLKIKNPKPVVVIFTVNKAGEVLQGRIKTPSDDPAMNESVRKLLEQDIRVTPLEQADIHRGSLVIEVALSLTVS